MLSFFLFLSAIYVSFGAVDYEGCKFELTDTRGITAEYDLTWFHLSNDVFQVTDLKNKYFEYMFNICGAIKPSIMVDNSTVPPVCAHPNSNHGPCINAKNISGTEVLQCNEGLGGGFEPTSGRVPSAIQIDRYNPNETNCYWLGMEIETKNTGLPEYNMELLHPDDAGKGVIFTILNGEYCHSVNRNRELRLKLECPDDKRIEFEPGFHQKVIAESNIEEIDTCIYELAILSPNACPNKCVSRLNLEMFAVCATHGICESDPYGNGRDAYPNGTLRCLCDDGYTGTICEEPNNEIYIIDQKHPGLLAAIIICIVLLGLAIVCAAVLCHKIRMRELVQTDTMHHLAGGMLSDENEANLEQRKSAVSMNISTDMPTSAVRLQTMDDMLEKDRAVDNRNELLDEEEVQRNTVVDEEEVEEQIVDEVIQEEVRKDVIEEDTTAAPDVDEVEEVDAPDIGDDEDTNEIEENEDEVEVVEDRIEVVEDRVEVDEVDEDQNEEIND